MNGQILIKSDATINGYAVGLYQDIEDLRSRFSPLGGRWQNYEYIEIRPIDESNRYISWRKIANAVIRLDAVYEHAAEQVERGKWSEEFANHQIENEIKSIKADFYQTRSSK